MAPVCVPKTLVPKWKENWHPLRTIHTNIKNMCMPPCVCHGEGLAWMVADGSLRWRARMSCRTSSQMWGSLYLPRFLLRDGSLTLRSMASLMVVVTPCASCLQWGKTVHTDAMPCRMTMLVKERGVFLNPFAHFAAICVWTLNPFSLYVHLSQTILIMIICVYYFSKILSPILFHNSCSPQGVNIHIPLLDKFLRYYRLYAASWVVKNG